MRRSGGLYADALEKLGQGTGLPPDLADRLAGVADQWRTFGSLLGEVLEADVPAGATFKEVASLVVSLADREAALFDDLRDELGRVRDRR